MQQPKPIAIIHSQRRVLIEYFYGRHKELFGKKPLIGYPEMIGRLRNKYEKVDADTGELYIDYPDIDDWKEEVDGYFSSQSGKDKNYSFPWFLGTIGQYSTLRRSVAKRSPLELLCTECQTTYPSGGRCKCG